MATDKQVWFGTEGRMTWIKAPATGMTRSRAGWSTGMQYLNGGYMHVNSGATHATYSMNWPAIDAETRNTLMGYATKIFGDGLIYFVDPFSKNILPENWAAPSLGATDGIPLVSESRPTLSPVTQSGMGLPTQAATYNITPLSPVRSVRIPVPRGYAVSAYGFGSLSGTANVVVQHKNNVDADVTTNFEIYPVSTMQITSAPLVNNVLGENDLVTVTLTGTGSLLLAGLVMGVHKIDAPLEFPMYFPIGAGNSGLTFAGMPTVTGYSSRLDIESLSADLVETGEWL